MTCKDCIHKTACLDWCRGFGQEAKLCEHFSVLISIHPKWCDLIASGNKTIEVRKTRPKNETPFRCYIYETKARSDMPTFVDEDGHVLYTGRGQVIGEFVCDYIIADIRGEFAVEFEDEGCIPIEEQRKYSPKGIIYGWHISDLKIYDKPRELKKFCVWKKCNSCKISGYESTACMYDEDCKVPVVITRPPQSWCYVEEL